MIRRIKKVFLKPIFLFILFQISLERPKKMKLIVPNKVRVLSVKFDINPITLYYDIIKNPGVEENNANTKRIRNY